jgi:hypothetical protein
LGVLALAAASAARTLSRPIRYLASAVGLISTRTAGSELPPSTTWPTPVTWLSLCCNTFEAAVVQAALADRIGGQCQDQGRRIGRVDLAVLRVAAEVGRQVGTRGIDCGLHVARRAVDRARQVELERDPRVSDSAGRGDLGDAAIAPSRRESGMVRLVATVSGEAPGRLADTWMVGKSTRGNGATELHESQQSGQQDADGEQGRRDRPAMNGADRFITAGSLRASRPAPARRRRRPGMSRRVEWHAADPSADTIEGKIDHRRG